MRSNVFVAGVCLLVAMSQRAALEETEEEGGSCPALTMKSARLMCETSGSPLPCTDARAGARARVVWKKTVLKGNKLKGGALMCQPSGEWKGVSSKKAPSGYKTISSGTYKYYGEKIPWGFALIKCLRDGANLLVINSEDELEAIKEFIRQEAGPDAKINIHVGITDKIIEGQFLTVDGEPLRTIVPWGNNEPSKGKQGDNEDCVIIKIPEFTQHDIVCDGADDCNFFYVCEIPISRE